MKKLIVEIQFITLNILFTQSYVPVHHYYFIINYALVAYEKTNS
jgi:hypothetical protein